MTPEPDTKGTTSEWITHHVIQSMISVLNLLPYKTRVTLTGRIVQSVIAPLMGYQARALENLALVYPEMPLTQRKQIARSTANGFGRAFIENYSGQAIIEVAHRAEISGAGLQAFKDAQIAGTPVLLMTAHFGNYEIPRYALDGMGYEIGALYRPMTNPFFNEPYVQRVANVSGPIFAQGRRGTAQFVRFLKAGGAAGLFFDIYARGARLPFLGQNAKTSLSSADLALKYKALVIPVFAIRQADGLSFKVEMDAPIPHTTSEDMVIAMNLALEARIKTHPEQWFWFHRRFK